MTPRIKLALAVAVAAVLAGAGLFVARRVARRHVRALDAIPENAFMVITVDVDSLRRSPLGVPLFGGAASKLAGEKTLTDLCGFDPLTRMTEIAVAVPEVGEPGEFGIAIRADVSKDELLGCARKVLESRQGHAEAAPSVRTSGSYVLLEPDAPPGGDPTRRLPTLAYRDGGPFLIARGAWLASMIDTVDGKLPSVGASAKHGSLRQELGAAKGASLVATAILPRGLRDRLKEEMGRELEADPSKGDPAMMEGVLGVESAGVGIVAGASGADTTVTVLARCEAASQCAEVEKLVAKKRLDWSQELSLRLFGVGPLLDSMKVDNAGTTLRVTAHAPSDEAAKWLERVLSVRGVRHPMPNGPLMKPPGPHPAPPPDEVVGPARSPNGGRGLAPGANPP